jgi:hypothetical protein
VRTLTLGLLFGLTASALRAPLGVELVHATATPATIAVAYRAIAFFLLAIALLASRNKAGEGFSPIHFLGGALLGLATHGLLLGSTPQSHFGAVLLVATAAAALYITARAQLGPETDTDEGDATSSNATADANSASNVDSDDNATRIPVATPLAHALIGCGLALSFDGVHRHLRLLSANASTDDTVFACVLAALVLVGAACFRNITRSTTSRTLCLAGAALGTWASLRVLTTISSSRGLDRYLRWFDLDTSLLGTLAYDALLAAVVFVIPAFLLGAGFAGLRRRSNLAGLAAGLAIGLIIAPHCMRFVILDKGLSQPFVAHEFPASHLILWGAAVAFAGAALHLVRHPGIARWSAISVLLVAPLPIIAPPQAVRILSPWALRTPQPELMLDTPEGLLTIEPTEFELDAVTLDRRLLSPGGDSAASDRLQLRASVALLSDELRASRDFHVLLLGQLTPGRALNLTSLGAARIDRTGAWHAAMPLLEDHLFHDNPLPEGEVLSPRDARARISNGEYDLIIAPKIGGEQPTTRNFASGPDTITVVWFDAAGGIAHGSLGTHVLISTATLEDLSIGLAHGIDHDELPPGELLLCAGPAQSRERPWTILGSRIEAREERARAAMSRRLAQAKNAGVGTLIAEGLHSHFGAQQHSSPYETLAQQIELSDAALASWSMAGRTTPPTRPIAEVLGAAARVLQGKRAITRIYEHLEPLAAIHPGWTDLTATLAYADLEALDPSHCVHRIETSLELGHETPLLHVLLADALIQLGRADDGVDHLWIAYEELPTHLGVRERLAMALVRAGEPEGRAMIEDLLLEDPDREHLRPYLETGPLPSAPTGYTPLEATGGHSEDHAGHDH